MVDAWVSRTKASPSPIGSIAGAPPKRGNITSYIEAYDPANQKIAWKIPNKTYGASGTMATAAVMALAALSMYFPNVSAVFITALVLLVLCRAY